MFQYPIGTPFRYVQSLYVHLPAMDWPDCGLCAVQKQCKWLKYRPCQQSGGESVIVKLLDCPNQGACHFLLERYGDAYISSFNYQEIVDHMIKDLKGYTPKRRYRWKYR